MKTAELMKKNKQLNKELMALKSETELFVKDVLSNPENQRLVNLSVKTSEAPAPQVYVSSNLDFHVLNANGELAKLPTAVTTSQGATKPTAANHDFAANHRVRPPAGFPSERKRAGCEDIYGSPEGGGFLPNKKHRLSI